MTKNTTLKLLRPREVAKLLDVATTTLWRWERQGRFPKRRKLGPNVVAWTEEEIQAWVDRQPRVGTDGADDGEKAS